jgi:hypothetical protein
MSTTGPLEAAWERSRRTTSNTTGQASRTVAAGRCNAFLVSGLAKMPCPCHEGTFEIRTSEEFLCNFCCHQLQDHDSFTPREKDRNGNVIANWLMSTTN